MPASRRWALRLVLLSLPLLALAAAEVSARMYFHFNYGVPGHRYGMSKYDPVLGAAPRELSYSQTAHLNDYAFRNSENVFQPKPAGSLRLITYGGSTVFCHDLANDESWSIRLQELLRSRRPGGERDQVLNGGVVAWSLGHSFERARRDVPALQPDAVILYSGVNEESNAAYLEREGTPMKDLVERGEYGRFTKNLATATPLRDVLLYKFMRDRVFVQLQRAFNAPSTAPVDTTPDPAIMTNYLEAVRQFITYLRAHGVTPIFVKEVYDHTNPAIQAQERRLSYSAKAATMVEGWGAVLVDPTDAFAAAAAEGRQLFMPSGVHVTVDGARLMADVIYAKVYGATAADR
jgi:lysophospholipase L1-like esterase